MEGSEFVSNEGSEFISNEGGIVSVFRRTHDFINQVRHKFNVYHHAFIYAVTVDIIKCRDILSIFDSSFINVMFDAYNICAAKLTFPSKSNSVTSVILSFNFGSITLFLETAIVI